MPLLLCAITIFAFFFSGRYILTNVVADKENKMRETLRIMGLTQFNYALSFFCAQGITTVIQAIIIGLCCFWSEVFFP
jgi:hypothetical protein